MEYWELTGCCTSELIREEYRSETHKSGSSFARRSHWFQTTDLKGKLRQTIPTNLKEFSAPAPASQAPSQDTHAQKQVSTDTNLNSPESQNCTQGRDGLYHHQN